MNFFTSPEDLKAWVISQGEPRIAANKILEIIGDKEQQDIIETCNAIKEDKDDNAAKVLFKILAKYNLTQIREGKMTEKLIKQAQQMRQDSLYGNMPLRICPKLPFSVGKKLISTYNCRHYCLDSIVFDDDPQRVYCAEALWRNHIMDKFSREWKDDNGKWIGGYINERFQVYHDDHGNNMQLPHGVRTRKPRPHQFSIERRLEEGRGNETTDITASSNKIIKLASISSKTKDPIYSMFTDIIDMKEAGISHEDILTKVSEHYGVDVTEVAIIYKKAMQKLAKYDGVIYAYDNSNKIKKTAIINLPEKSTLVTKSDIKVKTIDDGKETILKMETPVVMISNGQNPIFQIVDGPDAGKKFQLNSNIDIDNIFGILDDIQNGTIQEAADETGLNDLSEMSEKDLSNKDFPIVET